MVKKSRIVLSMTRLIYLFLLPLCTPESSESKTAKFGCLFDDTDFNLKLKIPGKAEFGEIDPNDTMYFADDKSFDIFLETITEIYSDFLESGLIYDSFGYYFAFYKRYNRHQFQEITNFSSFYATISVKEQMYEPGGNIITLMNKLVNDLVRQFPKLKHSSYFVTRSTISNETLLNEVIEEKTDALPECLNHEQIAGIIKFQYPGNHYGYILLDPEIGAYKPVVFKEGEHNPYKYGDNNENIEFRIPEPKNKINSTSQYITAKVVGSNLIYLYYYRKPFCSLTETTVLPSMLKFQHSTEKRDNKLVTVASFTAHVGLADPKGFAKNSDEKVYDVELTHLEQGKYEMITKFNFEEISSPVYFYLQDLMTMNNDRLNDPAKRQTVLEEDIKLLEDIKNDKKFLEQCESTLKQLDNARSKESAVDTSVAIE